MNEDTDKLLRENLRLAKENNRLLHKMRRSQIWGGILKFLWIAILIGVPVIFYVYVLQPYYEGIQASYEQFRTQIEAIPGFGTFFEGSESP